MTTNLRQRTPEQARRRREREKAIFEHMKKSSFQSKQEKPIPTDLNVPTKIKVNSQINHVPKDILQLNPNLVNQVKIWDYVVTNKGVDEAKEIAEGIFTKIIELSSQKLPYKGIYFCSGYAPFRKGLYDYRIDDAFGETNVERALNALKPFNSGNWTFVDKRFGKKLDNDKFLLDLCKSAGMNARLVGHDLNDGYPTDLGEECYDVTMLFEVKDDTPVELQHQYAMRALRTNGLIFPSFVDPEKNVFEYGGGLIEKVFLAGFEANNYIRSRFDYITHPNLCRKVSFQNHSKQQERDKRIFEHMDKTFFKTKKSKNSNRSKYYVTN